MMPWRKVERVLLVLGMLLPGACQGAVNPGGSVTGYVYEDLNGNNVREANEPCVKGVVSLRPVSGGVERTDGVTCASGDNLYAFGAIGTTRYVLSVKETTPADFDRPSFYVQLSPGQTGVQVNIPLHRLRALIHGVVAVDANGNRTRDAAELPMANVGLELLNPTSGAVLAKVFSGGGGDFSFLVSTPGEYLVQAQLPKGYIHTATTAGSSGNATVLLPGRIRASLKMGQGANGLQFLIRSTARLGISGRAVTDSNKDGLLDASDVSIPNLEMRLLDAAGNPVAATRSLDDGSYFFDQPAAGKRYLITSTPPYSNLPSKTLPGPGTVSVGSNGILIPELKAETVYKENQFLSILSTPENPLPAGPASIEGFVQYLPKGARRNLPLPGATLLLRDTNGMIRAGAVSGDGGLFRFEKLPTGVYTITETDPAGYVSLNAIPGQNGTRVDVNTLRVSMTSVLNNYAGYLFVDQPGEASGATNSISGKVTGQDNGQELPLSGVTLVLHDAMERVVGVAATDSGGQYQFGKLTKGTYRLVEADPVGAAEGDAIPGPHATRIDKNTLLIQMVDGVSEYSGNNFVDIFSVDGPGRIQPLVMVGDTVAATGRLGVFGGSPFDVDRSISRVRQVGVDGSVYIADYAGVSLLRLPGGPQAAAVAPVRSVSILSAASKASSAGEEEIHQPHQVGAGRPEILLDSTRTDPIDGMGLARLLKVEIGRDGTCAIVALRADNSRGYYRLQGGLLTRLGLLTNPSVGAELAIGDAGQIAYLVLSDKGTPVLLQTTGERTVQILGPGQRVSDPSGQFVLDGGNMERIRELTSNSAGDLAFHISMPRQNDKRPQAVARKSAQGISLIAVTGLPVQPGADMTTLEPLTGLGRPLIGANGTIACRGTGDKFVNFFVDGPGRPFRPMLPGNTWNREETTFDYDVAPDGTVALKAAREGIPASAMYLVGPTGQVSVVLPELESLQPIGMPAVSLTQRSGNLYFLAKDVSGARIVRGRHPAVLLNCRFADGKPELGSNGEARLTSIVVPLKDRVPGRPAARILSMIQRPIVGNDTVTFTALFGGGDRFPVPTGGLFRVPLGGTIADGTLLLHEGADLPVADRVAQLQGMSFTADGQLLFGALLPGSGPLVASVGTTPPTIASASRAKTLSRSGVRIQAAPASPVSPLLAIGQPLDRPDRRLLAVLGPLVALGNDRQLLVARYTQDGVGEGEGLFSISRTGQVTALAASGDAAIGPGLTNAKFAGFGNTDLEIRNPPSVSTDGRVIFKAGLDQDQDPNEDEKQGVFQWAGAAPTVVGLSEPSPDNLAISGDDLPPYSLRRWVAGTTGKAYVMEAHKTKTATEAVRLFESSVGGLLPLVVPGQTQVAGSGTLGALSDCIVNGLGQVFVNGAAAGLPSLMQQSSTSLVAVLKQGDRIPKPLDGTKVDGLTFGGTYTLMSDTARGDLMFMSDVLGSSAAKRGLFRFGAKGLETLILENLQLDSSRTVTLGVIGGVPRQTVSGSSAFATFSSNKWTLSRYRLGITKVVVQEGQKLPNGKTIVSLDAGPMLDLPAGSGPIFTLNEAGDVAFLASDGTSWGLYLFSDRP